MKTETVTVNANYKDICIPCEQLRALLVNARVTIGNVNLCELALRELLTNLVEIAYENNPAGEIKVNLVYSPSRVVMETQDTGKPVKVELSKVTSSPDSLNVKENSYGVAIIKTLVDEVSYSSRRGTNTWKLVKKLKALDKDKERA